MVVVDRIDGRGGRKIGSSLPLLQYEFKIQVQSLPHKVASEETFRRSITAVYAISQHCLPLCSA